MLDHKKNYVYIVISQTPTLFGRVIRKIMKLKYNHASIAFDDKLEELYSFGRIQNKTPIIAGLVKEYPDRFSLRKKDYVSVKIYKIPVTNAQYQLGLNRIKQIEEDKDGYLYNLLSVLSYPLSKGFATYKTYSCVEFVVHMIQHMNIPLLDNRARYNYTPEELAKSLDQPVFYEGNLLDYCHNTSEEADFFFQRPKYIVATIKSIGIICRLIYRGFRYYNGEDAHLNKSRRLS